MAQPAGGRPRRAEATTSVGMEGVPRQAGGCCGCMTCTLPLLLEAGPLSCSCEEPAQCPNLHPYPPHRRRGASAQGQPPDALATHAEARGRCGTGDGSSGAVRRQLLLLCPLRRSLCPRQVAEHQRHPHNRTTRAPLSAPPFMARRRAQLHHQGLPGRLAGLLTVPAEAY